MNLASKRKLVINAALVGFMVALAEEEDDEGHQHHKKRCMRQRKYWVNPYLRQRNGKGKHANFENLTKNPAHFFANFHMSFESFQSLFQTLESHLCPRRNSRCDNIRPEQKLAAVLEYLALGEKQKNVCDSYRISKQYFGQIVAIVCKAIAQELHWEIPQWEKYAILGSARDFEKRWNLPNCAGAIGGKLVKVKVPFCRQAIRSMPIFAVCDASLRFTYLDVGDIEIETDLNLFAKSSMGKAILSDNLYFPEDSSLNGEPTTYFFVAGDDTFPLVKRIMKPYGSKDITREETYFNNRLQKASNCIDEAFGILSARWMSMRGPLICCPDSAKQIATACCLLHNYLRRTKPDEYTDWSQEDNKAMIPLSSGTRPGRTADYPNLVRDCLKNSLIIKNNGLSMEEGNPRDHRFGLEVNASD